MLIYIGGSSPWWVEYFSEVILDWIRKLAKSLWAGYQAASSLVSVFALPGCECVPWRRNGSQKSNLPFL